MYLNSNGANTNFKYSISLTYIKNNIEVEIGSDKIQTMVIEYDYDKKNMPIILMRLTIDKELLDHMIKNENKTIILTLRKYKESASLNIFKSVIKDEFFYFLDNNMNYLEDLDYSNPINKDNKDMVKIITIGLMKKDIILRNKVLTNTVYNNSSLLDIVCDKFTGIDLLVEPFKDNKIINNFIVTPIETLTKFISFLDNQFTLYNTPYRFFYDFNRAYLLSSSGKAVPSNNEKYSSVFININNTITPESKVEGMKEDSKSKAYIVNVDTSNINISIDSATTLSYNKIIGIDSDGNTKSIEIDSDINGNRFKITRISNNNLDSLSTIKGNVDINKTVINIIKEQVDTDVFTINKEYYIKNYDKLSDKNGRYILAAKKELYIKETDNFQMTTIFTFKKCPST